MFPAGAVATKGIMKQASKPKARKLTKRFFMSAPDGAFLSSADGRPPIFAEKVRLATGRLKQWERIEKSGAAGKPCFLHVGEVGNCLWRLNNGRKALDRLRDYQRRVASGEQMTFKKAARLIGFRMPRVR
jgi:hypothetical protein